jgi:hypothetical protein
MDLQSLLEFLAMAFGGGVAWATLRARVRDLDRSLKRIRRNDLRHLQATIRALPCQAAEPSAEAESPEKELPW